MKDIICALLTTATLIASVYCAYQQDWQPAVWYAFMTSINLTIQRNLRDE